MRVMHVDFSSIHQTPLQGAINLIEFGQKASKPALPTLRQQSRFAAATGQQWMGFQNQFQTMRKCSAFIKCHNQTPDDWCTFWFGDEDAAEDNTVCEEFLGNNLKQGNIGNCFFIASLVAILKCPLKGKKYLAAMIDRVPWQKNQHFFEVRFPGYVDMPQYVSPQALEDGVQVKGGQGYRLLEMAYAQLSQSLGLACQKEQTGMSSALSHINGGGSVAYALHALTSQRVKTYCPGILSFSFDKLQQNSEPVICVAATDVGPNGEEDLHYADPENRLPYLHAFTLLPSPIPNHLTIINPWDSKNKRFNLSQDEFLKYFSYVYIVNPQQSGFWADSMQQAGFDRLVRR